MTLSLGQGLGSWPQKGSQTQTVQFDQIDLSRQMDSLSGLPCPCGMRVLFGPNHLICPVRCQEMGFSCRLRICGSWRQAPVLFRFSALPTFQCSSMDLFVVSYGSLHAPAWFRLCVVSAVNQDKRQAESEGNGQELASGIPDTTPRVPFGDIGNTASETGLAAKPSGIREVASIAAGYLSTAVGSQISRILHSVVSFCT